MTLRSLITTDRDRPKLSGHEVRRRIAVFALVAIPAALDLLTASRMNLAILYSIALVVAARGGERRLVLALAPPLALLAYAGYVFEFRHVVFSDPGQLISYRLLNRTMCAAAILVVAGLLYYQMGFRERLARSRVDHPRDQNEYEEILRALEGLMAGLIASVMVLFVLLTDLLVPAQFNLPILYSVPLLVAAWIRSRRMLWWLVGLLLLLSVAGFIWGRPPTTTLAGVDVLLTNRTLATIALLAIGVVLHFWLGRGATNQQSPQASLVGEHV